MSFFKECILFKGNDTAKMFGFFTWLALASTIVGIVFLFNDDFQDEDIEESIGIIVKYGLEEAYFEGQRDAIEGDIRIEKRDSTYVWIKSPWDDGTKPIFTP